MKKIITILFVLIAAGSVAQTVQTKFTESRKLEVTYNKTTNIVFPSTITSVDRGSQDVLVQKVSGAENVLRVKADLKNFPETNLTVITSDGKLYSFLVNYADHPSELNITIQHEVVSNEVATDFAVMVENKRGNVHSVKDKSSKVSAKLEGFYVKDEVIFFKLKLENRSRINFDIDQLHFYIRDKKKSKRTASQELVITPISITGDTGTIESKIERTIIVAVPKFTIPDGKLMVVEMMERNGGRHLLLRAKNRHLMKARQL
jgi:conjugative transposon TraN protein